MKNSIITRAFEEYNGENAGFQGGENRRPFWNVHSSQFIYNPKLCFPVIPGAHEYVFTARDSQGETHSFRSATSVSYLTEIWKNLPGGMVTLKVEAMDKDNNFICVSGIRTFFKCDGFTGRDSFPPKAYSYRECALKAYRFAYNDKSVQYLLKHGKPDPEYNLNVFPSKMLSGIINAMVSHRGLERSTVFAANSTQYYVKMLDNTQSIICAFSLSCYEFIAKTSSNYPSVKNYGFLVRKVQLG